MGGLVRNLRYDWPLHFLLLLTAWMPDNVAVLRLRGALVRPFLGRCGGNLRLGRSVSFYNPAQVSLGDDVYIAHGCRFIAGASIEIASEVLFGPYCLITSSGHSIQEGSFRFGPAINRPVTVGKGSWIGAHVTVSAGVTIGSSCLVGANSCVVGAVGPGTFVSGVPARFVRNLLD